MTKPFYFDYQEVSGNYSRAWSKNTVSNPRFSISRKRYRSVALIERKDFLIFPYFNVAVSKYLSSRARRMINVSFFATCKMDTKAAFTRQTKVGKLMLGNPS